MSLHETRGRLHCAIYLKVKHHHAIMKTDRKLFFLVATAFAAGFLFCLMLLNPSPKPQTASPARVVATGPMLAFTQFQPKTFTIVLPASENPPIVIRRDNVRDPLKEIDKMKPRSLDLIDTHYQPQIDLKDLDK